MEEFDLEKVLLEGNNESVQTILTKNPRLVHSYRDAGGDSLLHIAALNGNKVQIIFLIGLGADVNKRGMNNETPIYRAILRGYTEVVDLLIKYGARVNIGNDQSETPIGEAERQGFDMSHNLYRILVEQFKTEASQYGIEMYNRANSLLLAEKLQDAINAYDTAILYCPNHGESYLSRGKAYLKKGNIKAACLDWNKAGRYGVQEAYKLLWQYSPSRFDFEASSIDAKSKVIAGVRGLLNKTGNKDGFEGLVRYIIGLQGKEVANNIYRTLEFGWEQNNMPPVDYCEVYCNIFSELEEHK